MIISVYNSVKLLESDISEVYIRDILFAEPYCEVIEGVKVRVATKIYATGFVLLSPLTVEEIEKLIKQDYYA